MKFNTFTKALTLVAGMVAVSTSAFAGTTVATKADKTVTPTIEEPEAWLKGNLWVAWDSRYIFRGVDLIDDGSLFNADINFSAYGFTLDGWYANGLDKDYNEFDLTASYTYSFGPVDLTGGYIAYLYPNGDYDTTQEFFASIASSKLIPFITPSLSYYYDFDQYDGSYLEFKLASSIPVVKDVISIDPYALVSWNFDYNYEGSGWNHFQAGIALPWHVNKVFTLSGYGAVSVPIDELSNTQDTYVWGGVKATFSF